MIALIFSYLSIADLLRVGGVCKQWRAISERSIQHDNDYNLSLLVVFVDSTDSLWNRFFASKQQENTSKQEKAPSLRSVVVVMRPYTSSSSSSDFAGRSRSLNAPQQYGKKWLAGKAKKTVLPRLNRSSYYICGLFGDQKLITGSRNGGRIISGELERVESCLTSLPQM